MQKLTRMQKIEFYSSHSKKKPKMMSSGFLTLIFGEGVVETIEFEESQLEDHKFLTSYDETLMPLIFPKRSTADLGYRIEYAKILGSNLFASFSDFKSESTVIARYEFESTKPKYVSSYSIPWNPSNI